MQQENGFVADAFPLHGRRLIEASAGTGKTYNIANLYLRLLLGDENRKPLAVDEILVVTFTKAATNELRGRIREKVEHALLAAREGEQTAANKIAGNRLNAALVRMDEASIFTIHGFAVRAIQNFVFETGALADVDLSETGNARLAQVLSDLWRQLQMSRDTKLREYVEASGFSSQEQFYTYFGRVPHNAEILPVFHIDAATSIESLLVDVDAQVVSATAAVLEEKKCLLAQWHTIRAEFAAWVMSGNSSLDQAETDELLGCIESWLLGGIASVRIPARNKRPYNKLNPFIKTGSKAALVLSDIVRHAEDSLPLSAYMQTPFAALLLQYIREKMRTIDLAAMQLDEVIRLINNTLQAGGAAADNLRRSIVEAYPVCMVDEFQDTDPEQFAMFNLLYGELPDTGFFMIGDPKQSIYAFRGADIFSYLNVRQQVSEEQAASGDRKIFSLDTNFRSKQALVDATNKLFCENPSAVDSLEENHRPVFMFPGIDYVAVNSCESAPHQRNKGEYSVRHSALSSKPLVFIGNPADASDKKVKLNGDSLRRQYAHDTAQRIAALLDTKTGATIQKSGAEKINLQAADIAVLVRTAREAQSVRDALLNQQPPIGSVYYSQRDSVFTSAIIAEDIYHLLRAMDDPGNKALLKAAVVTPLFRAFAVGFALLDAIDNSDDMFEACMDEFAGYQREWQEHGVLAAINRLLEQRQLLCGIATLPDCDRLVTDLRHLGELLQQQYLQCGSREQLLIWYARQLTGDSELDEDSLRIRLESDENLVRIVTIHVSKGLEYPVVFVPFFFLPWSVDLKKTPPLFHDEHSDYRALVDFERSEDTITPIMQREMMAEDMRLLYVAVTRAVYQCYVGVSAALYKKSSHLFPATVWSHLLGIKDVLPDWSVIRAGLEARFGQDYAGVAYQQLADAQMPAQRQLVAAAEAALVSGVTLPVLTPSNWVITSYSALAHAKKDPGIRRGGADESNLASDENSDSAEMNISLEINNSEQQLADDVRWADDIRYTLKGSNKTGDCLHAIFEQLALEPGNYFSNRQLNTQFDYLLQSQLQLNDLARPERQNMALMPEAEREAVYAQRRASITAWLEACLDSPLLDELLFDSEPALILRDLFLHSNPSENCHGKNQALPEMDFDFSLGSVTPANISASINRVLQSTGVAGINIPFRAELEGLVTGSIDLLFIHNKKVYVLDYKSNTLGRAPRFYARANMTQAMQENRFDLQYLIYSVAAHRYMQQRLAARYAYDGGEYSFGGVLYLFLRGMGLPEFPQHGVWCHRPAAEHILALDAALHGALPVEGERADG